MKDGKIQQFGTPTDIYDEPVNRFVADFIGESNIVEGKMVEDFVVNIYGQDFECVDAGIPSGKKVEVVIRPEDISLIASDKGLFKATVDSMLFRGVHYEICCIDRKGYEWVIQTTKKLKSAAKLDFILTRKQFISWFLVKQKKSLINVLKVTGVRQCVILIKCSSFHIYYGCYYSLSYQLFYSYISHLPI